MKRIVAVILINLLIAPPAWADQKPGKPITWEEAQKLKAGTEIFLTVATGGQPLKVKLLFVDESVLVTLKPDTPKLPGRAERTLLTTGSHWPDIVYREGSFTLDQVRVSKDGVFDGDQKVADLLQTPRADVRDITEVSPSHLVRNLAIVGTVIAGILLLWRAIFPPD